MEQLELPFEPEPQIKVVEKKPQQEKKEEEKEEEQELDENGIPYL